MTSNLIREIMRPDDNRAHMRLARVFIAKRSIEDAMEQLTLANVVEKDECEDLIKQLEKRIEYLREDAE